MLVKWLESLEITRLMSLTAVLWSILTFSVLPSGLVVASSKLCQPGLFYIRENLLFLSFLTAMIFFDNFLFENRAHHHCVLASQAFHNVKINVPTPAYPRRIRQIWLNLCSFFPPSGQKLLSFMSCQRFKSISPLLKLVLNLCRWSYMHKWGNSTPNCWQQVRQWSMHWSTIT